MHNRKFLFIPPVYLHK